MLIDLQNVMNYLAENGNHVLGTIGAILVMSLIIVISLKLNYKDLWVLEQKETYTKKINA
ncbi:hypothetical protein [Anaerostipes sp. MSJ-23]|uniref:hypothetical protein n=1 Tax=Anaerostipes sp. MSJ-23 TaxID=2841520 RepID=UPI001C11FC14|nr:hypothetical protein [Anaerostipes sp. MSJ-23]MBU5460053.1 hypothetical protein [Anaerostipes sp. MSJ-23]